MITAPSFSAQLQMSSTAFSTPFSVTVSRARQRMQTPPPRSADRPASLGHPVSFRVNEAFPAAFSGSLNLMKLRPFQSVRPSVRPSGPARPSRHGAGRTRPPPPPQQPKKLRLLFPSSARFSPTFFYFTDEPQAEVKCYMQRECRLARSGRGKHSSIEVQTPAAILEANSILFCIPHLESLES